MSTKVTMTDTAYNCMTRRKREMEFAKLWQEVAKAMKIPDEQLARKKATFYSELMLDPRFAALSGNKWDLRNRRSFNEVHIEDLDEDDPEDEISEESPEDESLDLPKGDEEY